MTGTNRPLGSSDPAPSPGHRYGDAKAVGQLLVCNARHVVRMADEGVIPPGFKIGRLRRWDLGEIEEFVATRCQLSVRQGAHTHDHRV